MAEPTKVAESIAEQIAALHGGWYGRGPSAAKAFMTDEVIVVILEETFTAAEMGLIERDEAQGIREIRRRWQEVAAEDLKAIITQATGRQVRSLISDTDLREGIAVEVFLLGAALEDMAGFE